MRLASGLFFAGCSFLLYFVLASSLQAASNGFPLERLLNRASTISLVTVREGKRENNNTEEACSYKYHVDITEEVRGRRLSVLFTARKLKIGGEYLLIVAENIGWKDRQIGDDIPSGIRNPEDSCSHVNGSLMAAYSEIFPIHSSLIRKNLLSDNSWIVAHPDTIIAPKQVEVLHDFERVNVIQYRIDDPHPTILDYFKLSDVISLAKKGESK